MSIPKKRRTRKLLTTTDAILGTTDVANGQRLAKAHGRDLRYVHDWKKWLWWDGRRWSADDQLEVTRRAKEVARNIYREAADEESDDRRRALAAHAENTENVHRLWAMIEAAQSEPGIEVKPEALDAHPFLLNVQNGTLDLRTGHFRTHSRDDLITKLAPVAFDPDAEPLYWLAFLDKILDHNKTLIGYMQRLLGYSLTGDTREHCLPICWGDGQNGKSTLLNLMLRMLGPDYAWKASEDFLLGKLAAHEVAELFGKRFIACIETPAGRLNENMVKEITGGDMLRGCRKYEHGFNFWPTHKVWLGTNHLPDVREYTDAIWRRLKRIPFTVRIAEAERDSELPDKLYAERGGILAWCLQGCRDWLDYGVREPQEVTESTAAYRAEQDVLGAFIGETCVCHANARCRATELYGRYVEWCKIATGEKPLSQTTFGEAMGRRPGVQRKKTSGIMHYLGVGLAYEQGGGDS